MLIMVASLIPFAVSQTYVNTIRETGQTLVSMLASIAAVLSNLLLNPRSTLRILYPALRRQNCGYLFV